MPEGQRRPTADLHELRSWVFVSVQLLWRSVCSHLRFKRHAFHAFQTFMPFKRSHEKVCCFG